MKWDTLLSTTLVVCALTTTGLIVHREFFAPESPVLLPEQKTMFFENWRSQLDRGVRLGPPDAAVQIIEFADFECPFCATFHERLKSVRELYPTEIGLSFVHYPLPMHRFAILAARASECAGDQGRFEAMHDLLFERQQEFGLTAWSDLAADAGMPDLPAFEACVQSRDPVPRILDGQRLGEEFGIQGTPTLVINGWKLGRIPSGQELDRMVKATLAGKSPVSREENDD